MTGMESREILRTPWGEPLLSLGEESFCEDRGGFPSTLTLREPAETLDERLDLEIFLHCTLGLGTSESIA